MITLVRAGLGDERNDGWGRMIRAVEEALRLKAVHGGEVTVSPS